MIRRLAPKLAPFLHIGILAHGPRRYKYESGREGDWFHIGVASNKSYISLYVAAAGVADRCRESLPQANIGKGCVRFKRLSDLDTAALKKLIRESATAEA